MEHGIIRFIIFLAGIAFSNYAFYAFISLTLSDRESKLVFFVLLNLGIFSFLYFYGSGGSGKDPAAYLPAILCAIFWIVYFRPKPPKGRRRKVKVKLKARKAYRGVCSLPPGTPA